jgi:hypothetical protein
MSSALSAQRWDTSHLNVLTRKVIKQSPLEDKETYLREGVLVAKKDHNIAVCPKEEASKQVCQNRIVQFGKLEYPISADNFRTSGQCNKGFKMALDKYMSKNESTKRQFKHKASRIKHQTCYTCCDKGHLSKDCPKTQTFIHKIINDNITHLGPKIDTSIINVVSSPCDSHHVIWAPKHLFTKHEGPNKAWVPKFA